MVKSLATSLKNPTAHSLPPCNLNNCTKEQIKAYLDNTFDVYETLFSCLKDDSYFYLSPDRLRRPLIFYFVHTASLYVNKLMLAGLITKRINFNLESMCEIGVDEMSWDDLDSEGFDWPTVPEGIEYRNEVRKMLVDVIDRTPLELPITEKSPWWALFMGFEHDRIHLETSSVLLRQMPASMVERPIGWEYAPLFIGDGSPLENKFIAVEKGQVTLGKPEDFPSYGWDNEYGSQTIEVPEFQATQYKITNREFHKFVLEGGYEKESYWTAEGWMWKNYREAKHPTFWVCGKGCKSGVGQGLLGHTHCYYNELKDKEFKYRAPFDVIEMPWDWPAEVNFHEAKAYCNWLGKEYRVITEAEHHRLRNTYPEEEDSVKKDIIFRNKQEWGNLNLVYASSSPVNMYPPTQKGFYDVFGNVWEWAEDHFNGLPGFKTSRFYDDFSTPCFDGRHNVILGGAWVSTGDEASSFARFAFRRHFFQHLGFRVAKMNLENKTPARLVNSEIFILCTGCVQENPIIVQNVDETNQFISTNPAFVTETPDWLTKNLVMHYLPEKLNITEEARNYPVNCARLLLESAKKHGIRADTVLEIGCGVGRTAFEIARVASKVIAIDYTGRFIFHAKQLQDLGMLEFELPRPNDKSETCVAVVPNGVDRSCLDFRQLTCLPNNIGKYDIILVNNLSKLANPRAWLLRMRELTNDNALVMVVNGPINDQLIYKGLEIDTDLQTGKKVDPLDTLKSVFEGHLTFAESTTLQSCDQLTTDITSAREETLDVTIWYKHL
eukprot:TRINITY_DN796_c0_g3_i1.p1 TRINITY_DN796_c0_g3~~TRINITY_DN796_c0_g3_i1.p1  ORF type:complete len:777 (-),score=193.25 TRINITY_DN796_c0_g3_i1:220-2550(-)